MSREEVEQTLRAHGNRYLERIYTPEERAEAGDHPLALAARFAAKEATMKALRHGDEALPWRSIALVHGAGRRPSLRLSGPAADLARRAGVGRLWVSLSYRRCLAAAIVFAEVEA